MSSQVESIHVCMYVSSADAHNILSYPILSITIRIDAALPVRACNSSKIFGSVVLCGVGLVMVEE